MEGNRPALIFFPMSAIPDDTLFSDSLHQPDSDSVFKILLFWQEIPGFPGFLS